MEEEQWRWDSSWQDWMTDKVSVDEQSNEGKSDGDLVNCL